MHATNFGNCNLFENTRRPREPVSAEPIARLSDEGKGRVTVLHQYRTHDASATEGECCDLAAGMPEELDRAAKALNISWQAVIKTLIHQGLAQQYLARGSRASGKRW